MQVFIDIETIPSQHKDALAEVRASLRPPGTLKKAESIQAWWDNEAETAAQEAHERQALDGGTRGEIVSIAVVCEINGMPLHWVRCRVPGEYTEDVLLQEFAGHIEFLRCEGAMRTDQGHLLHLADPWFIAHNAAFDLGFLWRRCVVHNTMLPFRLPSPNARAGKDYGCTMQAWAGYGGRVSLDTLCRTLGVKSPKAEGMDGSQVYRQWKAGEYEAIERYNLADAVALAEVWPRLQLSVVPF